MFLLQKNSLSKYWFAFLLLVCSSSGSLFAQAPTLTEVTTISEETYDSTPSLVIRSSKAGTATYENCSSSIENIVAGNNLITLNELNLGTYDDCTIKVEDSEGNQSSLVLSEFEIFHNHKITTEVLRQPLAEPASLSLTVVAQSAVLNIGYRPRTYVAEDSSCIITINHTTGSGDVTNSSNDCSGGAITITSNGGSAETIAASIAQLDDMEDTTHGDLSLSADGNTVSIRATNLRNTNNPPRNEEIIFSTNNDSFSSTVTLRTRAKAKVKFTPTYARLDNIEYWISASGLGERRFIVSSFETQGSQKTIVEGIYNNIFETNILKGVYRSQKTCTPEEAISSDLTCKVICTEDDESITCESTEAGPALAATSWTIPRIDENETIPELEIVEFTPVSSPSTDPSPDVIVFANHPASISSYSGSCSSSQTNLVEGLNTITLNSLDEGTYNDCSLTASVPSSSTSKNAHFSGFEIEPGLEPDPDPGLLDFLSQKGKGGSSRICKKININNLVVKSNRLSFSAGPTQVSGIWIYDFQKALRNLFEIRLNGEPLSNVIGYYGKSAINIIVEEKNIGHLIDKVDVDVINYIDGEDCGYHGPLVTKEGDSYKNKEENQKEDIEELQHKDKLHEEYIKELQGEDSNQEKDTEESIEELQNEDENQEEDNEESQDEEEEEETYTDIDEGDLIPIAIRNEEREPVCVRPSLYNPSSESLFNDTDQKHRSYSALIDLAKQGIVNGDNKTGQARLDEEITRGEIAKIISIARGDEIECLRHRSKGKWYEIFVHNLEKRNILGTSHFPERPMSKFHFYQILLQAFGHETEENFYQAYEQKIEELGFAPHWFEDISLEENLTRGDVFSAISLVLDK